MDSSEIIRKAKRDGKRVYLIGNGGSFANAAHIANDLLSKGVRAHTLDAAFLTATANDMNFGYVYARWILTMGEPGDVLVALSGSGKSLNILAAIEAAEGLGMEIIRIFGAERGQSMQKAEEFQVEWGHELWATL